MSFSFSYALLFILAGFAAAAYHLRAGSRTKHAPIVFLSICALFTLSNYGLSYAALTIIEFAIGFGIAHAVIKVEGPSNKRDSTHRDSN